MSVRVLVVDDQAIVREGLMTLLSLVDGIEVIGGAADGEQALQKVQETAPDVVLMDLSMPHVDGVTATGRIVAEHTGTAVLVLTTFPDEALVLAALQAGARGYLTKDADRHQIARAVLAAADGQTTLDPAATRGLLSAVTGVAGTSATTQHLNAEPKNGERAGPGDLLTERERQVLALIATGASNGEIGRHLHLAQATVKTHVNHIFAKLQVTTRSQAVVWAHCH